MSYSRSLRVLIVEDDPSVIRGYQLGFKLLKAQEDFDLVAPFVAGGYDEAVEALGRQSPIHLVVLDLKLPKQVGGDPDAFSGSGLDLIQTIAEREAFPVPALLILTGEPKYIQSYSGLSDVLRDSFFYAAVAQKSADPTNDFRAALEAAQAYVDFGACITDPEELTWPTLTLREDDLLRRFGLSSETYACADLRWWSAERKDRGSESLSWSKVLWGHFWMREQEAQSRNFFFKFESRENGDRSYTAAKRLESTLQHVQVMGHFVSSSRSLIVTAQATHGPPVSLSKLLRRPTDQVVPHLVRIADDIASQLAQLGAASKEPKAPRELLWPHHRPQISSYDRVYRQFSSDEEWLPSKVLDEVEAMSAQQWVSWRTCQHGDLHLGNISLDESADSIRAYLIDPGWMEPDACGKDLASLELALVLHQDLTESSIAAKVLHLFGGPRNEEPFDNDPLRNTTSLMALLRERALQETDLAVYSLLLLDQALMQLGSLVHGVTANKIIRPLDAAEIYRSIAEWCLGQFR